VRVDVAGCKRTAELVVPVKDPFQTELGHAANCRTKLLHSVLCPGCPQYVEMVEQHQLHNERAAEDTLGNFQTVPINGADVAKHNAWAYKMGGARKTSAAISRAQGLQGVTATVRAPTCDGIIAHDGKGHPLAAQCLACTDMRRHSLAPAQCRANKPRSKKQADRRTAPGSKVNKR